METQAGKQLLNTAALKLETGKAYLFTGPSGSGKSLFLRSLFGWTAADLQPVFRPTQGQFYLLQDPGLGLTAELTIGGHFREVGQNDFHAPDMKRLLEALHLGIPDLFLRKPAALSGGERQRIMLALILIQNPKVLVCDEPAASLDDKTQQALWGYLFQQQQEKGMTLLIATHRYQWIQFPINVVFHFDQGEIIPPRTKPSFMQVENIHLMPHSPVLSRETKEGLRARDITLAYGSKTLLELADLHLQPGETQWLSGVSGSGKTTLAQVLAGRLPGQKATLQLHGEPLDARFSNRKKYQQRAISYLFQHGTESLNPYREVGLQLEEAFQTYPADLLPMLQSLRLDSLNLKQTPDHFSIGELQRLNLARALSQRPAFLLADELLAPLDAANQAAVLALLALCQRHWHLGIFIFGHDLSHVPLLPGRVSTIRNGRFEVYQT